MAQYGETEYYLKRIGALILALSASLDEVKALTQRPMPFDQGWRDKLAEHAQDIHAAHKQLQHMGVPIEARSMHKELLMGSGMFAEAMTLLWRGIVSSDFTALDRAEELILAGHDQIDKAVRGG